MRRACCFLVLSAMLAGPLASAQTAPGGPYKVLKTARVGGEGGWDYIYADSVGRRLYIPRRGVPAVEATGAPAVPARLTVFDLDTLAPVGEIAGVGGNGAVVDPKSGYGFTSSRPVSMFDARTLKAVKTIDVTGQPDGILFDAFNERVYVFSHPTKDATVIDSKTGAVVGTVDLGGTPEQAVVDGKGTLYAVMQDPEGSVTKVDVKTLKAVGHFPLGDKGGCNGLALDAKHGVLFAACARSGNPLATQPMMVVLSAKDGHILANLPLAGGSDGAAFNPKTGEAFSTQGNGTLTVVKESSPTAFAVEQNLQTMNGARTIAFDAHTGHLFTMSVERGPAPPAPADGGRPAPAPAVPGSFTILVLGK